MIVATLPPLRVVAHAFTPADLRAGHLALDFINTAAGLNRDARDWLDSYARLVEWAELAGVCGDGAGAALLAAEAADKAGGRAALERVRRLRAALYSLVLANRDGLETPSPALDELQQWCRRAGGATTLSSDKAGVLRRSLGGCGLDVVGATVALAAVALLEEPLAERVGVCGGRNCGWLFVDATKSRRRRWCDMKTCGNAAKASRHYQRKLAHGGASLRST